MTRTGPGAVADPAAGSRLPHGLSGRVALVTGAGQGIGAAIAARLAAEGCVVAVNSLQPPKAEATAERLPAGRRPGAAVPHRRVGRGASGPDGAGGRGIAGADRDPGEQRGVPGHGAVGRPAAGRLAPAHRRRPHRSVPLCAEGSAGDDGGGMGRVVNLSSIWGLIGAKGATAYCAAKGGLVTFARALHAEVVGHGVAVTAVAPGIIDTPQLSADAAFAGITLEEMKARYATQNLVGRIGTPGGDRRRRGVPGLGRRAGVRRPAIPVTGGRSE